MGAGRNDLISMPLNVNFYNGDPVTTLNVDPSWMIEDVRYILEPYIQDAGATCRELRMSGSFRSLDYSRPVGSQLVSGQTLVAIRCEEPELQEAIKNRVRRLSDPCAKAAKYQNIEALAELGMLAQDASAAVEKVLLEDPEDILRKSAANALAFIGSKSSAPALSHAAKHDTDKFVRERAQEALNLLEVTKGRRDIRRI